MKTPNEHCNKCGSKVLIKIEDGRWIGSSDYLEEMPELGICRSCLLKYCLTTNCSKCIFIADPNTCFFKDTKKLYQEEV